MKKRFSAGVVITDGKQIIICLPYMNSAEKGKYDLPKGRGDGDELPLNAAVREVREETGLELDPSKLIPLGRYTYNKQKDLILYLYKVLFLPDIETLHCGSLVYLPDKPPFPEVKAYKYVNENEIDFLFERQARIINSLKSMIFKEEREENTINR